MKDGYFYHELEDGFVLLSGLKRLFNQFGNNFVGIYQISDRPGEYGIKCYFSEYVERVLNQEGIHIFCPRVFDKATRVYSLDFDTTKKLLKSKVIGEHLHNIGRDKIYLGKSQLHQMFILDELEKLSIKPVSACGLNEIGYNPERESAFVPSNSFVSRLKEECNLSRENKYRIKIPRIESISPSLSESGSEIGF